MSPTEPETPGPGATPTPPVGEPTAAAPESPAVGEPPTQVTPPPAPAAPPPPPPPPAEPPRTDPPPSSGLPNPHGLPQIAVERPEVAVGAAFAGGLLFAAILKRFGR